MAVSQITTVVTPAAAPDVAEGQPQPGAYDLIDLATLKDDLGVTTTADDPFLQRAITRSSAAIAEFCNRVFPVETVTDTWASTFVGYPMAERQPIGPAMLSRYPVVEIETLYEFTAGLMAGTDYIMDAEKGLLYRINSAGQEMCWVLSQTSVTYQAGFVTIPADVQDAVSRLVKARYAARTRDPLLRSTSIPGIEAVTFAVGTGGAGSNMPDEVADALSSYRVPVIA